MEVRMAGELGYCSGVSRAIAKAAAYAIYPPCGEASVYSLGTIAHNEQVVEYLRGCGVEPIKIEDLQPGMRVAITAHGSPPAVYARLKELKAEVLDCTCSIVRKSQEVAASLYQQGYSIIIFGDPLHQEVKGIEGWARGSTTFVGIWEDLFTAGGELQELRLGKKVGILSQTTKIPEEYADFIQTLAYRFLGRVRELRAFNTICPHVADRLGEAEKLAKEVDVMFVVGSQQSANTANLVKVCRKAMETEEALKPVFLVTQDGDIERAFREAEPILDVGASGVSLQPLWKWAGARAGVTAGTSTPIEMVEAIVRRLKEL